MKKLTGKDQNKCLLVWHVLNVLLKAVVFFLIEFLKIAKKTDLIVPLTSDLYTKILRIVSTLVNLYVDLFLLWLLYRFNKP